MKYSYVHGLKNVKKKRWDLILAGLILFAVVVSYVYVAIVSRNSATADNSNNQPISKVFGATDIKNFAIIEEYFEMSLKGDWEKYEVYPNEVGVYRYRALGNEHGRVVEVFVDSLPKPNELYMTHLLPVSILPGSNRVQTDQLSDLCRKFAPIEPVQTVGVVKARWKNIEFDCDVHRYRNIVGTSTNDGYNLKMLGKNWKTHFFFRYTDHGTQPTNSIFIDILETFKITY